MLEQESSIPQSDRDFKAKESPEQVREKTPEGVLDRAKNWLEKRRQIREAYEANKDYDVLSKKFFDKEDKVFSDTINADGGGVWLSEGVDKEKIDSSVAELRSLIEETRQFERDKLGMNEDSSRVRDMVGLADDMEEDLISLLNKE
ncbi:MAG: hypothetical protein AAB394_02410 [Patescibacteria group bacterium]